MFSYIKESYADSLIKKESKLTDDNLTGLVIKGDGETFWNAAKENNYPISYELSGLFVKYLIDNLGLNTFKKLFIQKDLSKTYLELYNLHDTEMINGYFNWIKNITRKLP